MLSGYLPNEDRQGLSALEAQLLAEPDREILVVGRLVQHSLTEPRGPGSEERDVTLTLKWAGLEPVLARDEQQVASLMSSLSAERKRQEELHFGDQEVPVPGAPTGQAAMDGKPKRRRGRGGLSSVPAT